MPDEIPKRLQWQMRLVVSISEAGAAGRFCAR
jgi:hypothetical protein